MSDANPAQSGHFGLLLALAAVALVTGCSVSSTKTLDRNFEACLNAGGDYTEPVADGIGFSCDLPEDPA